MSVIVISGEEDFINNVSKNQEINKLLTFFEDASHLYFNSESFTGGDYYEIENAKYILYLFRNVSVSVNLSIFHIPHNYNYHIY